MDVEYRKADMSDLKRIVAFVDFWLTGGGVADGVSGAGHDFFVPYGRHKAYLEKYQVLLAIYGGAIVGWAVKTKKSVLIHLLVAGTFRGSGIGRELLAQMDPDSVRSKFDQSTGDPSGFYLKHGYVKSSSERFGKKHNIELFVKSGGVDLRGEKCLSGGPCLFLQVDNVENGPRLVHQRSIDALAERGNFGLRNSDKYSY